MYQIIYDYFSTYIWDNQALNNYSWTIGGQSTNLNVWLSHTCTIIILIILVILLCLLVRFVFRQVANALRNV